MSEKKQPLKEMVSGILAGGTTVVLLHPLDMLKTRFQATNTSEFQKIFSVPRELRRIWAADGLRKGLYRGFSANFLGSTLSWGLYFAFYNMVLEVTRKSETPSRRSSLEYFFASGSAGLLAVLLCNPIWLAKTRLCQSPLAKDTPYHGLLDCWKKTYKHEGLRGLYRGLLPGFLNTAHGAFHFVVYENLKSWLSQDGQRKLSIADVIFSSCIAKTCALSTTYPLQTIRCRLQMTPFHNKYVYGNIGETIIKTWKREGLKGYYKGLVPSILRVLPATCITFIIYEKVSFILNN